MTTIAKQQNVLEKFSSDLATRGVTGQVKEGTIPQAPHHYGGAKSARGPPNDCAGRRQVPTMPQVFSSVHYICFQKTSGSNMGVPNLLFARGAI